jgi:hypothetical protein
MLRNVMGFSVSLALMLNLRMDKVSINVFLLCAASCGEALYCDNTVSFVRHSAVKRRKTLRRAAMYAISKTRTQVPGAPMLENDDNRPKESSEAKARRMWRNKSLIRKYKLAELSQEAQLKLRLAPKEPERRLRIGDVIETDGRRAGSVKRLETKFLKDIRAMLQGLMEQNLKLYAAYLAHRKHQLLREKLRRLELAQREREQPAKRDLFGD